MIYTICLHGVFIYVTLLKPSTVLGHVCFICWITFQPHKSEVQFVVPLGMPLSMTFNVKVSSSSPALFLSLACKPQSHLWLPEPGFDPG